MSKNQNGTISNDTGTRMESEFGRLNNNIDLERKKIVENSWQKSISIEQMENLYKNRKL